MAVLSRKLGEMAFDGLVTDIKPQVGKLVIFGTTAGEGDTLTADCILCDDVTVGTAADVKAPVYIAGCFDPDKLVIAEGATITEAVKDTLRTKGIILKAAAAAN